MRVVKYHGTGNDFLVVDAGEGPSDPQAFARAACDRETGLAHPDSPRTGADGVLLLSPDSSRDLSRVRMTLAQPDGSTAAMCGNGVRCAADWAVERLGGETVVVETGAGPRRAEVGEEVTVEMGVPLFDPEAVPVDADEPMIRRVVTGSTITAVNTGVPHAVAFVDDVAGVDLASVGPEVRHAAVFPEGANFTIAARRGIGFDQRTYERGVEGETRSCGTGAVAVVAAATRLGAVDRGETVPVRPPGGRLDVTVTDEGATLRGPVAREFVCEVPDRLLAADAGDR